VQKRLEERRFLPPKGGKGMKDNEKSSFGVVWGGKVHAKKKNCGMEKKNPRKSEGGRLQKRLVGGEGGKRQRGRARPGKEAGVCHGTQGKLSTTKCKGGGEKMKLSQQKSGWEMSMPAANHKGKRAGS